MDFSLTEEQSMLADSVARFIDNDYDFDTRQAIAARDEGFSSDMWRTFAELGWTAVPFAEEDGGLGGGPVELMLMMEQFGRGLLVEPFLANIVLAGGVLRRVANDEQKARWLAPLIEGELQAALAFAEPQSRFDTANIATTAARDGDSYVLNGSKSFVLNGGTADLLIIPARIVEDGGDDNSITLFAVAEAVGIMQIMHDKTVEYSKNRVQFGVPIGTFQALQHRMVETMIACEQSRSLMFWCVMLQAAGDPGARRATSALKYQVGTAGIQVAREAVQIHGGMGVSWDMDIAHFFKRISVIDITFGNADYHLDRYVDLPDQD